MICGGRSHLAGRADCGTRMLHEIVRLRAAVDTDTMNVVDGEVVV